MGHVCDLLRKDAHDLESLLVPFLSRISASCVSLAYFAVIALPCAMSESIETSVVKGAGDTAYEGMAHSRRPNEDDSALHENVAKAEPTAQLSAPCPCSCSDSPDSARNSSARIGFALARAGWNRALELDPLRHAAPLSQPPQAPDFASDPVPG